MRAERDGPRECLGSGSFSGKELVMLDVKNNQRVYGTGFKDGVSERLSNRAFGFTSFASEPSRRSGRRPH